MHENYIMTNGNSSGGGSDGFGSVSGYELAGTQSIVPNNSITKEQLIDKLKIEKIDTSNKNQLILFKFTGSPKASREDLESFQKMIIELFPELNCVILANDMKVETMDMKQLKELIGEKFGLLPKNRLAGIE